MENRLRRAGLVVVLLLVVSGVGTVHVGASPVNGENAVVKNLDSTEQSLSPAEDVNGLSGDEEESEDAEDSEEDETGASLIGDWWGLGGEVGEAPYIGVVEAGVVLLVVGVLGYSLVKRKRLLPVRYRRYQLQTHQWIVLIGTGLTLPHFIAVEEWEGLGLAVAVLLGVEVVSGLYGRYLHRHVVCLGRGDEKPSVVGRLLTVTKETLFSRWRRVHVLLTVVTAIVLLLHIITQSVTNPPVVSIQPKTEK
ncbi:hypothetical protein [Halogeometricum sp. CBA1124]|uniref:hypothetical protein n=1 Tax=Halogeometricum sp. CBA1124 TaxID=2668071 RepID=UPI00142950BC|nr:hypothetical protein [Halogeometricum sp. CBA1124]MUV58531.1 hypothetical protein [Halogeometricum sp. CBA1124]